MPILIFDCESRIEDALNCVRRTANTSKKETAIDNDCDKLEIPQMTPRGISETTARGNQQVLAKKERTNLDDPSPERDH